MKFYIATKFENIDYFKSIEKLIKKYGHDITEDWTLHKNYKIIDFKEKLIQTKSDLEGIKKCDILLFLYTGKEVEPGRGSMFELGYAEGLNKNIIILDLSEKKDFFNKSQFFSLYKFKYFDNIHDFETNFLSILKK